MEEPWGANQPNWQALLCIRLLRQGLVRRFLKKPLRTGLARISPRYDIEVAGIKMRCYCDNATEYRATIAHRQRTLSGTDLIDMIISGLRPGDVFFDIGANCGLFTLFAARQVGSSGCVVAVEPIPDIVNRLKFNVAANQFSNVRVVESAVGAEVGTNTIFIHEGEYGQSRMFPVEGYIPRTVPVTTLLNVVQEARVDRIDAMKVDIEGYEDQAIIPFLTAAPRRVWPQKVLMETRNRRHWREDCSAALETAGYRVRWSDSNDALYAL